MNNISIHNTLIKDPSGRIKYKKFDQHGKEHFHVGVWIEGPERELDSVFKVTYKLHPSFRHRDRVSYERANNFSITLWTWGLFDIEVCLSKKDDTEELCVYNLDFNLPKDDDTNYIDLSSRLESLI